MTRPRHHGPSKNDVTRCKLEYSVNHPGIPGNQKMNRSNSHGKKKRSTNNHDLNSDGRISALETRFAQAQSELNPRRRQLVRAILDSAEETCFLSSRELAKRYRVDATT